MGRNVSNGARLHLKAKYMRAPWGSDLEMKIWEFSCEIPLTLC